VIVCVCACVHTCRCKYVFMYIYIYVYIYHVLLLSGPLPLWDSCIHTYTLLSPSKYVIYTYIYIHTTSIGNDVYIYIYE